MVRNFDIILYGASGFTGFLVAEYLSKHAPKNLHWALAGRSKDKLEDVKAKLGIDVPVYVADAEDIFSLRAVAAKTNVLITTVGPFIERGTNVLKACIEEGTHYVDSTGEYPWVRQMIKEYDQQAKEKGVIAVPMCGFDSVPSDLGTFKVVSEIRKRFQCPTTKVTGIFSIEGSKGPSGVSGGTAASLVQMRDTPLMKQAKSTLCLMPQSIEGGKDQAKAVAKEFSDAHIPKKITYGKESTWIQPFLMSELNTRLVRRSAGLFAEEKEAYSEGEPFDYCEYEKTKGLMSSVGGTAGSMLGGAAMGIKPLRNLMMKKMPKPGEGPSASERSARKFTATFIGEPADKSRPLVICEIRGGDGYDETAKYLAEGALCLTDKSMKELPESSKRCGFLTPAVAFGERLQERIQDQGTHFGIRLAHSV